MDLFRRFRTLILLFVSRVGLGSDADPPNQSTTKNGTVGTFVTVGNVTVVPFVYVTVTVRLPVRSRTFVRSVPVSVTFRSVPVTVPYLTVT